MHLPLHRGLSSKLRYISTELFGDFSHYLWGTFEFYMAIGVYLFALWIRIYVHYLAQYLYLQVSCSCIALLLRVR